MKGLRKYIPPFAPDQSGACEVLFELGGIIVICDAGGCAGNVCGFDEPRWFTKKSAIFSAGLRDMDAILGRDDKLVQKLQECSEQVEAEFAAIIGTPVPAVIATDYKALTKMAKNKLDLPVLAIDTTGVRLYDEGAKETYVEMFETFTKKTDLKADSKTVGVIGMIPLDLVELEDAETIKKELLNEGYENVYTYGMGSGLDCVKNAGSCSKNIVVSPAGLDAAKYLKEQFNTPYEVRFPCKSYVSDMDVDSFKDKKVLIIHQQVLANSIRDEILKKTNADVTVATWFMLEKELKDEKDIRLLEEDQFEQFVEEGNYDVIIGDSLFERGLKNFKGTIIDLPHFAVSGRM